MRTGRATVAAAAPAPADDASSPPPESEAAGATTTDDGGAAEADRPSDKPGVPAPDAAKQPKLSPTMRKIRDEEDLSLKAWLDGIGTQGAFKVQLRRTEPESCWDPRQLRNVKVKGYLGTFDHTIDEAHIAREYGGGTFALRVTRPDINGSYRYEQGLHRTIEVAGEPRIDRLPSNVPPTAPAGSPQSESGPVVQHALDMLERMVSKQGAPEPKGIDPAMSLLLEQMRSQQRAQAEEMAELRKELGQARNQKPPEDPIKDELLKSMISGQSGHVTALQLRYEAEIRQIKEGAIQDQRRIEDRHDRAMSEMRQSHELSLANLKASFEREIAALRVSHETALAAARGTSEVQVHTLNSEIKRLERDNDELRKDNRELREKKDKSVIDQIKDMKVLKEAFSDGEEGGEGSTIKEIVSMVPAAIEGIGGIMASRSAAAAQPAQAQARAAAQAQQQRPRVVRAQNGETFVQAGNKLIPAKPKPKVVTTDAGETIEVPKIEEPTLKLIISQLEAAFGRDEDPNIVAQSAKAMIPPDILAWIRQHHSEQTSGVDLFMQKVAKLPGTSPLASQAGRNWLRKVGASLTGE